MAIHRCIILRNFLEEINQCRNVRESFDSGLNHSCNFLKVKVSLQNFLHVWKCSFIKYFRIHFLNILAIHPAKLVNIKYSRRFINVMIIKFFNQFPEAEDLVIICRTPAQKGNIVYNCLGNKSLIQKILIGGMSGTFGQFGVSFIRDQRTMYINRNIPAKCLIDTVIFRGRGKIFIASYYMCDSHKMIVYNVSKIISRISVRFDQDQILKLLIVYCNISVNYIMESGSSLCRHVKTNYMWLSGIQTALNFFLGKLQAAFVINGNLLACYHALHAL